MENKVVLRKELLNRLSSLPSEELQSLSFALTNQLIKLLKLYPDLESQIGAGYLPLKAEVAPVYQELLHQIPVTLAYPILKDGQMLFGIPQGMPKGVSWLEPPYSVVEPLWILVPGVGFDLRGMRLGRGGGFYDRYLEEREEIIKIGLAWSEQIKEEIPVENHDCHMDFIITEKFCWDVNQQKRF